ncbi:MAG: hypothetical protein KA354_19685 [Phycisphaerae bacterium]|nr:hypothetical protein [Phycisphaerae bacterium]
MAQCTDSPKTKDGRKRAIMCAAGLAFAAASFLGNPGYSKTIEVTPEWSYEQVNALFDGDPKTTGMNGEEDAVAGDTVHFKAGEYILPQEGPGTKRYFLVSSGGEDKNPITIEGEGNDTTIFRGFDVEHVRVWQVNAKHVEFRDIGTESAQAGFQISDIVTRPEYDGLVFTRVKTKGHPYHLVYNQQQTDSETKTPSITLNSPVMEGGIEGISFSKDRGAPASAKTKYLGANNGTFKGLSGTCVNGPTYRDSETGEFVTKGNNDLNFNVMTGCGGNFTVPMRQGFQTPAGLVEVNIGSGSLASLGIQPHEGILNREFPTLDELMLDDDGRPMRGSPLIDSRYPLGYAGSMAPRQRFDFNEDDAVNGSDFSKFVACVTGPSIPYTGGLPAGCDLIPDGEGFIKADSDRDGDVDQSDVGMMQRCFSTRGGRIEPDCVN